MTEDRPTKVSLQKIRALPNREQDKQKAATEKLARLVADTDRLTQDARSIAKLRKIQYDALREAGFTDYQALIICAKMY